MLVSELIKQLEDCNPDYEVVDFDFNSIEDIEEDEQTEEVRII